MSYVPRYNISVCNTFIVTILYLARYHHQPFDFLFVERQSRVFVAENLRFWLWRTSSIRAFGWIRTIDLLIKHQTLCY